MSKFTYRELKQEFSQLILTGFAYTCVFQMNDIIGQDVSVADMARFMSCSKPIARKILEDFVAKKVMKKYRAANCDKYWIDQNSVYLSESIHNFHAHSYSIVRDYLFAKGGN